MIVSAPEQDVSKRTSNQSSNSRFEYGEEVQRDTCCSNKTSESLLGCGGFMLSCAKEVTENVIFQGSEKTRDTAQSSQRCFFEDTADTNLCAERRRSTLSHFNPAFHRLEATLAFCKTQKCHMQRTAFAGTTRRYSLQSDSYPLRCSATREESAENLAATKNRRNALPMSFQRRNAEILSFWEAQQSGNERLYGNTRQTKGCKPRFDPHSEDKIMELHSQSTTGQYPTYLQRNGNRQSGEEFSENQAENLHELVQPSITTVSILKKPILLNTSTEERENKRENRSKWFSVRFGKVEIREYAVEFYDTVPSSSGPWLGIGWEYVTVLGLRISDYELKRRNRRREYELWTSSTERERRLREKGINCQFGDGTPKEEIKCADKNQSRQGHASNMLKIQQQHIEVLRKAVMKFQKMIEGKRNGERTLQDVWEDVAEEFRNSKASL